MRLSLVLMRFTIKSPGVNSDAAYEALRFSGFSTSTHTLATTEMFEFSTASMAQSILSPRPKSEISQLTSFPTELL